MELNETEPAASKLRLSSSSLSSSNESLKDLNKVTEISENITKENNLSNDQDHNVINRISKNNYIINVQNIFRYQNFGCFKFRLNSI